MSEELEDSTGMHVLKVTSSETKLPQVFDYKATCWTTHLMKREATVKLF